MRCDPLFLERMRMLRFRARRGQDPSQSPPRFQVRPRAAGRGPRRPTRTRRTRLGLGGRLGVRDRPRHHPAPGRPRHGHGGIMVAGCRPLSPAARPGGPAIPSMIGPPSPRGTWPRRRTGICPGRRDSEGEGGHLLVTPCVPWPLGPTEQRGPPGRQRARMSLGRLGSNFRARGRSLPAASEPAWQQGPQGAPGPATRNSCSSFHRLRFHFIPDSLRPTVRAQESRSLGAIWTSLAHILSAY